MKSFKQMIQSGEIKRADAMKIRFADLHVEPGFNLRAAIDSLEGDEREQALADDEALFQHVMAGGQLPPLEVRPRDEGGVFIVDGHRRHAAIGRAIEACAPIEFVSIVAFTGNDLERCKRIMTSQEGRKLRPLEVAAGYKRLAGFGLTPDQIAAEMHKTRQHGDQMLILANAPHAVKQMVQAGTVSATEAMKVTRQHGENATEVLGKAAEANGGKKVTAKALEPYALPKKVLQSVAEELDSFVAVLPKATREELASLERQVEHGATIHDAERISVPASALLSLIGEHKRLADVKAKHEERHRAQLAKAAQGELAENNG